MTLRELLLNYRSKTPRILRISQNSGLRCILDRSYNIDKQIFRDGSKKLANI